MKLLLLLITFSALALPAPVRGQTTNPAPKILSQSPCQFTTFAQQSAFLKRYYTQAEFDAAKNSTRIECSRIQYLSDGLRVVGYIVKPRDAQGSKRYPVIVYNRGGFQDLGKLDTGNLLDFYNWASNGFIIVASQYRGNDGGEGTDQVGGTDVDDVLNLAGIASGLPYADTKNIFMCGHSRGGMMTFLELRRGMAVNAAAVVGAVYDLDDAIKAVAKQSPGVPARIAKLIPNYGPAALSDRAVMNWPERVNVPLLMIHGGQDDEVPLPQALAFAGKMNALHKDYQFIVYGDDIHEAAKHRAERDAAITDWFKRFIK
jgi:dipeptidyl aminopeptidase/acylaminoacyl peptidase